MRLKINSCFVTFVPPSGGQILAIYNTLYGLCKINPLDGGTYVTKRANFWLHPPPMSLDTYSFLYFNMCISVVIKYLWNCGIFEAQPLFTKFGRGDYPEDH